MKLVFVGAWAVAAGVMAMTGGAGVGMAMETGGLAIMGCWCWGMTEAMAIARAGRLGTGGEGNWLRISTFIAGRPFWNKGKRVTTSDTLCFSCCQNNPIKRPKPKKNAGCSLLLCAKGPTECLKMGLGFRATEEVSEVLRDTNIFLVLVFSLGLLTKRNNANFIL